MTTDTSGGSRRRVRFAFVAGLIVCLFLIGAAKFIEQRLDRPSGPPEVTAIFPADAEPDASQNTRILASFSRPLVGTAESTFLVVRDEDGDRVQGSLRFNSQLDMATFQPAHHLTPGEYSVTAQSGGAGDAGVTELRTWSFHVTAPRDLADGAGGSILVIENPSSADTYLSEILRAEGLNSFDVVAPAGITAAILADHAVAIVGAGAGLARGPGAALIHGWVAGGGDLVLFRPDGALAELAGLTPAGQTTQDAYFAVDGSAAMTRGIATQALQFHGAATDYATVGGTAVLATILRTKADPTPYPALTMRRLGRDGTVVAFSFDLATSVLRTRQGNPDWAGQERDGLPPIRPNDLFTGMDGEPDYLDLDNIGIAQADEQMRLLTNILVHLHEKTAPLPRFWYLPNGKNAALLMAADDHGTKDGTDASFEHMLSLDTEGCSVAAWECPRATSWIYPSSGLSNDDVARFDADGFDVGVHVTTECHNWTPDSLEVAFARSFAAFESKYSSASKQSGSRTHCIVWSDWLSEPVVEENWGIGLDLNYYNWPPQWIQGHPGYMTGSALPMRFSDGKGRLIDVFQQETHLVNESWGGKAEAAQALIAAAQGESGYYGVFGTHYDFSDDFDRRLMDVAEENDVPMISAEQLLNFTKGRNASSINGLDEEAHHVYFTIDTDDRVAGMLTTMLPIHSSDGMLAEVDRDGIPVDVEKRAIRGIDYAFFPADDGAYTVFYR